MYIDGFKFEIEKISDLVVKEIEELMIEQVNIANDYSIMKEQFGKIIHLKKELKLDSLDIVFTWKDKNWDVLFNKESYKAELAELYNRINYKLTNSNKIPTFFRGGIKQVPSFHLPAGANIWFLTVQQFLDSKIKPYIVICFGDQLQSYLKQKFDVKETKDLFNKMKYIEIDVNDFFDTNKHIREVWSKN